MSTPKKIRVGFKAGTEEATLTEICTSISAADPTKPPANAAEIVRGPDGKLIEAVIHLPERDVAGLDTAHDKVNENPGRSKAIKLGSGKTAPADNLPDGALGTGGTGGLVVDFFGSGNDAMIQNDNAEVIVTTTTPLNGTKSFFYEDSSAFGGLFSASCIDPSITSVSEYEVSCKLNARGGGTPNMYTGAGSERVRAFGDAGSGFWKFQLGPTVVTTTAAYDSSTTYEVKFVITRSSTALLIDGNPVHIQSMANSQRPLSAANFQYDGGGGTAQFDDVTLNFTDAT